MRIPAMLAAVILGGCAAAPATPPAPRPATTTAAAVPAAPAAPAAAAAPAAKPAAANTPPPPGGITPELYAEARQLGYRARQKNGQTIFCRNETPIGSRLTRDSCVSANMLADSVRQMEAVRDQMRRGDACGKDLCGGN